LRWKILGEFRLERMFKVSRDCREAISCTRLKQQLSAIIAPFAEHGAGYALVEYPLYSNAGDHLIWLGARRLLRDIHGQDPLMTVAPKVSTPGSRQIHAQAAVIYLSGGGNFGALYRNLFSRKLAWIAANKGRKVVQLPQTLWFGDDQALLDRTCRIIEQHGNFLFMARDLRSFEFARRHFPCQTALAPDMAFALAGAFAHSSGREASRPILSLLRRDAESAHGAAAIPGSVDWARGSRRCLSTQGMILLARGMRHLPPAWEMRAFDGYSGWLMRQARALLRMGRIVISDRLHGHILCLIMGIPHVMVDNRQGKISGFMETWKTEGPCARLAPTLTLTEAFRLAADLLDDLSA